MEQEVDYMNSIYSNPEDHAEIREVTEVKKIALEILLHIKCFCEKNHIRYYLGYGTLLGAIRHKGFIPWDDDIDILMPRMDYNRFLKLHEGNFEKRYIALNPSINGYYYNYCKVVDTKTTLYEDGCKPINNLGIYVDIFPLDGMPDERRKVRKQLRKLIRTRKIISGFGHNFPHIRKNIILYLYSVFQYFYCSCHDLKTFQEKYLWEVSRYRYEESKYVYATGGAYGEKSVFLKKWFDGEKSVEFEGHSFSAPIGFDEILQQLYKNYMELPPEDKQVSRHNFTAFYKLQDKQINNTQ